MERELEDILTGRGNDNSKEQSSHPGPKAEDNTSGEGGMTSHYLSMPRQNRDAGDLPSASSYLINQPTSKDEITVDFGNMFSASESQGLDD